MRMLLDTTYLLPLIGFKVERIEKEDLFKVFNSGHHLLINQVSIFEILGKSSSLITRSRESKKRVQTGLKAIMSSGIEILPIMEKDTIPIAIDLIDQGMRDIPDVPIVASALIHADSLMTEAKDIPVFLKKRESELQVFNISDFCRKSLS